MLFRTPRHWRRHTITYTVREHGHTEIVHTLSRATARKAALERDPDVTSVDLTETRRH